MGIAHTLQDELTALEDALETALHKAGPLPLYSMVRYFFGHEDAAGNAVRMPVGKRLRSALLLRIAHELGGSDAALDLAVAVELFHNFTLIHDDIEDNDELRRGRPTVWARWGVAHGINAGDATAFLANEYLLQAAARGKEGLAAATYLNARFREVAEGQYRDFVLAETPLDAAGVSVEAYLEMIRQKSAVLIGGSTAAGALVTGQSREVEQALYRYGESLGMAYQIADDLASLWGEEADTGKRPFGDLIERKKTYPVLYGIAHGATTVATHYADKVVVTAAAAAQLAEELVAVGAFEASKALLREHVEEAREALAGVMVPHKLAATLLELIDVLVVVPQRT